MLYKLYRCYGYDPQTQADIFRSEWRSANKHTTMSVSLCLRSRPESFISLIKGVSSLSRVSPAFTRLQSTASPSSGSESKSSNDTNPENLPFISTGIHHARFPVQEMLEIHRRAAKLEDPKYERRRRIKLIKGAIGLAFLFGLVIAGPTAFHYVWVREWYP